MDCGHADDRVTTAAVQVVANSAIEKDFRALVFMTAIARSIRARDHHRIRSTGALHRGHVHSKGCSLYPFPVLEL
jgi:hypothetical protein